MGWTKEQLVDAAFEELTLAEGDGFGITPAEKDRALRRMDAMVAVWATKGVRIGYAFPASPDKSSLSDDSGIPDYANEAVFLQLAKRLAPGFGKTLSPQTLDAAKDAYNVLLWAAAQPQQQQLPNTVPRGAGTKPWRVANRPFLPRPDTGPIQPDDGGNLTFLQE